LIAIECIATENISCDGYELLKLYARHNLLSKEGTLCYVQCMTRGLYKIKFADHYFRYENEDHFFNCSKFVHNFVKKFGIFEKDFVVVEE